MADTLVWDMLEIYNTANDTWTAPSIKFDHPTSRQLASAVSLNGRLYVIGGRFVDASGAVEAYYPDSNAWRPRNSLITPRIGHVSALVNERIYVIGGTDSNNNLTSVEEGVFSGPPDQYLISGNVSFNGQGLSGVILNGLPGAYTDSNGNYKKLVDYGWTSDAVPVKSGYAFSPESRTHFYIKEDQENQNYNASIVGYSISGTVTSEGIRYPELC